MSALAAAVVATVAVASLAALVAFTVALFRRVRQLTATLGDVSRRIGPVLAELSHEAEAAERELGRIADRHGERGGG